MSKGGPASILVVGISGEVVGLDAGTGDEVWKGEVDPHGDEVELVVQDRVVFAACERKVACFELANGRLLGRIELPSEFTGRTIMLVEQEHLFISVGKTVCCYTLRGNLLWKREASVRRIGTPAMGFPNNVRQADRKD